MAHCDDPVVILPAGRAQSITHGPAESCFRKLGDKLGNRYAPRELLSVMLYALRHRVAPLLLTRLIIQTDPVINYSRIARISQRERL